MAMIKSIGFVKSALAKNRHPGTAGGRGEGMKISDLILVPLGILVLIVFVWWVAIEIPVVIRGYQKYGIYMKGADVLKLEALEKGGIK
jgi:hypothetical protein